MIFNNLLTTYFDMVYLVGVFLFIIGAAMGSFLNVVVSRLITEESILGRSHCDSCKKTIAWYDLVPIVSYFVLGGKCRFCHTPLSLEYPLVELATGLIYVGTWIVVPPASLILYLGIVSSAWMILLSDLRYQLISDYMQLSFFLFILFQKIAEHASLFSLFRDLVAGLLVCIPIAIIYGITRERAMGMGDVILAFIIGFYLQAPKGFLALYVAFIAGAIIAIMMLIQRKKNMKSAVPFGPFLLIGMLVASMWGGELIEVLRGFLHV